MSSARLYVYYLNRTTHLLLSSALFILSCIISSNAESLDILADIVQPVSTEFGIYNPIPVTAQPSVASYAPAGDLSNVANIAQFSLTPQEKTLLAKNGFVVTPSTYGAMHDVYEVALDNNLPIFVSVDLVLHSFHEIYDYTLRTLETQRFIPDLQALTQSLLAASQEQMQKTANPTMKEAALRNVAYFAIAAKLLDPAFAVPQEAQEWVDSEWEFIQAHEGVYVSPLFGFEEDYSQYVPRGHYTLSEGLKRYFQAMMWYGRMTFRADGGISVADARLLTQRALLIVQLMQNLSVNNEPALAIWNRIYQPTVFFVGKSDDLTFHEYHELALEVYGSQFDNMTPDELTNEELLDLFIARLAELPMPRINADIDPNPDYGLRFMGQRFIPDSYILDNLAAEVVPDRPFPRGLDVMVVLGSKRAEQILDEVYRENGDAKYIRQMAKMKVEFSALEPQTWAQNVYWNWLYCLMPLLAEKGIGFPFYMQNGAWRDKELSSALGSWAELRHDTILYAKQSGGATGIPPSKSFAWEGVEPNPWAFARLGALCRYTVEGLARLDVLVDEAKSSLEALESLTQQLKTVAEKELAEQALTVEEKRSLRFIGSRISNLISRNQPGETIEADDDMAVIADVHTEFFSGQVMEVGVGRPLNLYVVVNAGDRLLLAVGSVFSYYEFLWPMNGRLTDEAWRKMLSEGTVPSLSPWMGSYMDTLILPPYRVESIHFEGAGWEGQLTGQIDPTNPQKGDVIVLSVFANNGVIFPIQDDLFVEIIINDRLQIIPLPWCCGTSQQSAFRVQIPTQDFPNEAKVKITVFSPLVLTLGYTTSFTLGDGASVREWGMYD